MKKLFIFGIVVLLFAFIKATLPICGESLESLVNKEDIDEDVCKNLRPEGDKTHCCYISKGKSENTCMPITDDEYENIKRFKKWYRDYNDDQDFKIKCSSQFVSFSLLAALAFLI